MKKLLFICLIIAAISQASAQKSEFLNLYHEYKTHCDSIVYDTITESGKVTYKVKVIGDDIKLIPTDTVWNKENCNSYANRNFDYVSTYYSLSDLGTLTSINDTIHTIPWMGIDFISDPKTISETFTTKITREKVCKLKWELPSFDGFWKWLDKKGYLK